MITMEEYSLISYGTGGSDPRSNHATRISTTVDNQAQFTRTMEVIRVEFTRPLANAQPQPSIMMRLRTVLNKMLSMGIQIAIKSNLENNTTSIRTVEELCNVDVNSFFQRVPDNRTNGHFPDKVVFVLDTGPDKGLAAFKKEREFIEYLKSAKVHMFVNEHKTFFVKTVGYLFKKSPQTTYIDGVKTLLEQYVNKHRSAEDQKHDYAYLEVDARITVPLPPRTDPYTRRQKPTVASPPDGQSQEKRPTTFALQIRCENLKYKTVLGILSKLQTAPQDPHLIGQFVPHLPDEDSQAELSKWVIRHNMFANDLAMIRINGLHPDVLAEPIIDPDTKKRTPVVSILYSALTATYMTKANQNGPTQERLIECIEPTRRSQVEGEYFIVTTQAKREATLEHISSIMKLVSQRSSNYKRYLTDPAFSKGITIPQTGEHDPTINEAKEYLKLISPVAVITTDPAEHAKFMHYSSRKPSAPAFVFDDGVSTLTEFGKLDQTKPQYQAQAQLNNAWDKPLNGRSGASVGTDTDSIASGLQSLQTSVSQISTMFSNVQQTVATLKANDDRREALYERRETESQTRHVELLRQQQTTATILDRLMNQTNPSVHQAHLHYQPDHLAMPPPNNRGNQQLTYANGAVQTATDDMSQNTHSVITNTVSPNFPNTPNHQNTENLPTDNHTTENHTINYNQQYPNQPNYHYHQQPYHYNQHQLPPHMQPGMPTGYYPNQQPYPPYAGHGNYQVPTTIYPQQGSVNTYSPSINTALDQMSVAFTEDQSISDRGGPNTEPDPETPPGVSGQSL